jgi:hypothetical protein
VGKEIDLVYAIFAAGAVDRHSQQCGRGFDRQNTLLQVCLPGGRNPVRLGVALEGVKVLGVPRPAVGEQDGMDGAGNADRRPVDLDGPARPAVAARWDALQGIEFLIWVRSKWVERQGHSRA